MTKEDAKLKHAYASGYLAAWAEWSGCAQAGHADMLYLERRRNETANRLFETLRFLTVEKVDAEAP